MTLDTETVDGRKVCKLGGELTIWEAADAWSQIEALLKTKSKTPLVFDLSAITSCDGAGIQILCQIQHAMADHKETHIVSGLSEEMAAIVQQAGLDPHFLVNPLQEKNK
jgi:anti-anti-sigma factor